MNTPRSEVSTALKPDGLINPNSSKDMRRGSRNPINFLVDEFHKSGTSKPEFTLLGQEKNGETSNPKQSTGTVGKSNSAKQRRESNQNLECNSKDNSSGKDYPMQRFSVEKSNSTKQSRRVSDISEACNVNGRGKFNPMHLCSVEKSISTKQSRSASNKKQNKGEKSNPIPRRDRDNPASSRTSNKNQRRGEKSNPNPGRDGDNPDLKLKCVYTNADSTINKRRELEARIEESQPDIIAITEVLPKIHGDQIQKAELELDGYDCFTNTNPSRGVCLYTKKWLKATKNDDLTEHNFRESVWYEVKLKNNDNLLVGCVYRSPNGTSVNNDELLNLVNMACERKPTHLLVVELGDVNYSEIDWDAWSSSAGEMHGSSKFVSCLQDNFLSQLVSIYTRYREGQCPSLLDLVIVNEEQMVSNIVGSSALGKSDHIVLNFDLNCYAEDKEDKPARHIFAKGDYEGLRSDLSKVNWSKLDNLDTNAAWSAFADEIHERMEKHILKTKPRSTADKKRRKPLWMTGEVLRKVKKKYNTWKRYTATKHYGDYQGWRQAPYEWGPWTPERFETLVLRGPNQF